MKYLQDSFSVAVGSPEYRSGWEATFGPKDPVHHEAKVVVFHLSGGYWLHEAPNGEILKFLWPMHNTDLARAAAAAVYLVALDDVVLAFDTSVSDEATRLGRLAVDTFAEWA